MVSLRNGLYDVLVVRSRQHVVCCIGVILTSSYVQKLLSQRYIMTPQSGLKVLQTISNINSNSFFNINNLSQNTTLLSSAIVWLFKFLYNLNYVRIKMKVLVQNLQQGSV
ncbi:hypothetical protein J6590_048901 [Homalodisca vitripennis]|nr:hypothetical protein J6590_048901 [Homalodisca vitripennis]